MELMPEFEMNPAFWAFGFLAFMLFLQLLYIALVYSRLAFFKMNKQKLSSDQPPVSIIIAARNEADNLSQHLPLILNQQYPKFEVVVVNHQSIDDSYQVLNALKLQFGDKLKVVEVERSRHLGVGKKFPLSLGIKSSTYENLLFTDADCAPASDQWLSRMVARFRPGKEIVIGFAPYRREKGLLNSIIRLDTAMIGVNYLSFALARMPYMGVGRNLAYTKSLFNSVNGFKSHYAITSGDDDLFVQETAKKRNYVVQFDPQTYCYSKAKSTWKDWMVQKSRHYSTSPKYQVIKKILLGIYPLSLILAWISLVILLFDAEYRWIAAASFLLVMILKWWIQGKCLLRLQAKGFVWLFPFVDLFYAILTPTLYYTSDKASQRKWK